MNSKFQQQRQMEMENERNEYGRRWSRNNRDQDEWRNEAQPQNGRLESETIHSVRSVSGTDSEYENRYKQTSDLYRTTSIYELENILRTYYPDTQSHPDEFGCIRRNPRIETNPLLCNLRSEGSTRDTKEAVIRILRSMLNKIPEYQIECSTIRGIGSHRITRFDLVETEVIQERIKAILNGSKSVRRDETLKDDEISVYDKGMKEYIQSNRLLDYVAEFLWKAGEKADRPSQVNGLNETKPTYDYNSYYRGKVVSREPSEYGFVLPHEKEEMQSLEREYMANPPNRNYRRKISHAKITITHRYQIASA